MWLSEFRLTQVDIFDYIEVFYDRDWALRHSHLGCVSPEAF